jgi:hypothetical protein
MIPAIIKLTSIQFHPEAVNTFAGISPSGCFLEQNRIPFTNSNPESNAKKGYRTFLRSRGKPEIGDSRGLILACRPLGRLAVQLEVGRDFRLFEVGGVKGPQDNGRETPYCKTVAPTGRSGFGECRDHTRSGQAAPIDPGQATNVPAYDGVEQDSGPLVGYAQAYPPQKAPSAASGYAVLAWPGSPKEAIQSKLNRGAYAS